MPSAMRVFALSVLGVALSVGAVAQSVSPTPQMKQLGQWVGKWVYQEEFRAKPDATWEKGVRVCCCCQRYGPGRRVTERSRYMGDRFGQTRAEVLDAVGQAFNVAHVEPMTQRTFVEALA